MTNFVKTIVDAIVCIKHGKAQGEPCYTIPASETEVVKYSPIGVCDHRAKRYGCTGRITKASYLRGAQR